MSFLYKKLILEHHLDTFGHVNNATYLSLYEEARWERITAGGFGLKEIIATQTGPVILEANVRYMREIGLRETISITMEKSEWNGKIGTITQKMINESGAVCSEATFKIGFMDLKSRKLITPPVAWTIASES